MLTVRAALTGADRATAAARTIRTEAGSSRGPFSEQFVRHNARLVTLFGPFCIVLWSRRCSHRSTPVADWRLMQNDHKSGLAFVMLQAAAQRNFKPGSDFAALTELVQASLPTNAGRELTLRECTLSNAQKRQCAREALGVDVA